MKNRNQDHTRRTNLSSFFFHLSLFFVIDTTGHNFFHNIFTNRTNRTQQYQSNQLIFLLKISIIKLFIHCSSTQNRVFKKKNRFQKTLIHSITCRYNITTSNSTFSSACSTHKSRRQSHRFR